MNPKTNLYDDGWVAFLEVLEVEEPLSLLENRLLPIAEKGNQRELILFACDYLTNSSEYRNRLLALFLMAKGNSFFGGLTAAFGHLNSKRKTAFAKDVFECILRFLLNSHEFPMDLCDFEFVLELILEQADVRSEI